MTLNADRLVRFLKTPVEDAEFQSLLTELALPLDGPNLEAEELDLVAVGFGVTLFFTAPHWMQDPQASRDAKPRMVLSDIQLTANGYRGGPPFAGELPEGLKFCDTRDGVYERLGPSESKAMFGIPNERWMFGERYLTIDFRPDYQSIKKVTTGVVWNLVKR